jgi:predicted ATPase/class 3 adenylate cyclase
MSGDTAASSGVLTFLFTDIEGSTRRWEADPDATRVALETHYQVLREAVKTHSGKVFNYTGDGMCAVFASPRSAVDAAVAAQLALELPVRMGIATGEAELRGSEYFGTVLNRTARVMAAGHGGQILIDGATAGLLSGAGLIELGPRRLRDIARPIAMFQVRAPDLRTEFPPLKTMDSVPGNLRPPATSFVGRQVELADVEAAVKAHRMVTLTGVGGVGKTRLAIEVASRMKSSFADGVWLVELASVGDPSAVPEAVAAVLGVTQQPGLTMFDSVAAAMEGRSRLLVIDNCEHVLDAAADLIDAIVAHSSTVKVIATSREGLRMADEQLWPVPSLEVLTGTDSAAATLFIDRAQAVSPGASLAAPDEASAVVEICQRLDGIPLAIELASSRVQSMTAVEIRDRLDDRFRLLVGSRRGLERHQTLRHAVQWSFDLLEHTEKNLLACCSVFAGGFDLPAACAVVESEDDLGTLDLLHALVRKSLVVATKSSGRTRFSMLETIRQFAEENLVAEGRAEDARAAHARYFAGREPDVMTLWDSSRQRETYEWFVAELANLRAAFRWSADHDDLDTAAVIAVCATFVGNWVEQYEPIAWAEELLASAKAADHRLLAQLYTAAAQCYALARTDDTLAYTDAARTAIDSKRYDEVPERFEASLAAPYIASGQPERAIDFCRKIIERPNDSHVLARTSLVMSLTIADLIDDAVRASDDLLVAADASDNPHVVCFACLAYGMARREVDPAAARHALNRGLTMARNNRSRQVESHLAVCLARISVAQRDLKEAFDLLAPAIRNHYDSGGFSHLNNPLALLAVALEVLGHHEAGATISGFAANPYTRGGVPEINSTIAHLRGVLGQAIYDRFAVAGEAMTNAAMAAYAFEQIDLARADLPHADESP